MPAPVGRPPFKVDKKMLERVKRCGMIGMTMEQTARLIGIHPDTLVEKRREYPELDLAFDEGRQEGIERVAGGLFINATERSTDKDGNEIGTPGGAVAAQIPYLKQNAGWRDKVEVSGDGGGPLIIKMNLPENGRAAKVEDEA